ncbi:MAG: hypothetical protein MUE52_05580 [Tabrizicola sp.]|jgi:hypothetical protein|nr:hypothetical protein [Tabrizicola sp.]
MSPVLETLLAYLSYALGLYFILEGVVWVWRRVSRRTQPAGQQDQNRSDQTGRFSSLELPAEYDAIARMGTTGEAARTLDDRILRTSSGARLLIVGIALFVACILFLPGLTLGGLDAFLALLPVPLIVPKLILMGFMLDSVLIVFCFEARYSRDVLLTTGFLRRRREFRWRDLSRIEDDKGFHLMLHFKPGERADVLKHCRGIEEFKLFAQEQLAKPR